MISYSKPPGSVLLSDLREVTSEDREKYGLPDHHKNVVRLNSDLREENQDRCYFYIYKDDLTELEVIEYSITRNYLEEKEKLKKQYDWGFKALNIKRLEEKYKKDLEREKAKLYSECVFEHFKADCYRLLLGARYPRVRKICDDNRKKIGMLTVLYPGYHSFQTLIEKKRKIQKEPLVKSGLGMVWAAAILEEDKNFYLSSFGVVFEDEMEFPQCIKMDSREKCNEASYTIFPLDQAANDKEFIDDALYIFLLGAHIPDQAYMLIGEVTIDSESDRQKRVAEKIKHTQDMRDILIHDPALQEYVMNNPDVINDIVKHFERINVDYKDYTGDEKCLIDINEVQRTYTEIKNKVEIQIVQDRESVFGILKIIYSVIEDAYADFYDLFIVGTLYKAIIEDIEYGMKKISYFYQQLFPEENEKSSSEDYFCLFGFSFFDSFKADTKDDLHENKRLKK